MNIDFSLTTKWKMKIKETINDINNDGLPLVLFGNVFFPVIDRFLQNLHIDIFYICDNNPAKKDTPFYGCEVILPDELTEKYEKAKYNVLILVPFEYEITKQLQALPKPPKHIFYLDLYFYKKNIADSIAKNMDKFEKTGFVK